MTWQLAITLQILVSSFMTLLTRRLTLTNREVFFSVGLMMYFAVAVMGIAYSILLGPGLPSLPSQKAWIFIICEGLFIPAAWLVQYKLIGLVGASNAVIITAFNIVCTAVAGVLLLNEVFSAVLVVGAIFLMSSVAVAVRIDPDTKHHTTASVSKKLSFVIAGALLFAMGMTFEKMAINTIGVWDYAAYGWLMQFVGALLIFMLFGRVERTHLKPSVLRKGLFLGFITSIAGLLYIYALSKGSLGKISIASSGKIALTMLLAAIFLYERNAMRRRILAALLAIMGLVLVVGQN